MLKYQQERQSSAQANSGSGGTGAESSTPKVNSVVNGESLEDIRKVTSNKRQNFDFVNMLVLIGLAQTQYKYFNINLQGSILCCIVLYYIEMTFFPILLQNLLKKQVETRTADGRRRITPLCIAQLDTG